jgi:hypothetical protein
MERRWPAFEDDDVSGVLETALQPEEALLHAALGHEPAAWGALAWTAIEMVLVQWPRDHDLGPMHAVGMTDRRVLFVECHGAVTDRERRRGRLAPLRIVSFSHADMAEVAPEVRRHEEHLWLLVRTGGEPRRLYFHRRTTPKNLENAVALADALRKGSGATGPARRRGSRPRARRR